MARTAILGFPRVGPDRELKVALESHWAGSTTADELETVARELHAANIAAGRSAGIDVLPVGDFALYDHVLDTAVMAGIVAERHRNGGPFAAARGGEGVRPLEMTKWFDTNYHYLVPELAPDQSFALDASKWLAHLEEHPGTRPVAIGPFSLLALSKGEGDPLAQLPALTEVYLEFCSELARAGATEIQLDEPYLVLDPDGAQLDTFSAAYERLIGAEGTPEICIATYFSGLPQAALDRIARLAPAELHVDLVRNPEQLDAVLAALPERSRLSTGVIDGRNIWATDLDRALDLLDRAAEKLGSQRLTIAPSCSLLHVPYSAARETGIDPEVRAWLAFGEEKLAELSLLARALDAPTEERDSLLADARERTASRASSRLTHDPVVRNRVAALRDDQRCRQTPIEERLAVQADRLELPELPTTTIGSFPQTREIRAARADHRAGKIDGSSYEKFLRDEVAHVIAEQEKLGFDVLVHGEPERNDMVEYFGEKLAGFAFSSNGWVQSYGSRCVKPPILYGDVSRPNPMTVDWWSYAQGLTERPVKGMLTGPVTILQWSFVRDDQPRAETCAQIALAVSDEVSDLQAAGATIVQVDEAALREGVPLRADERADYLRWAVDSFLLATATAAPELQIHTHMCYSEFGDMIEDIARLDADVISIEASRSDMELLAAFERFAYPGEIGPGVYDIHSPRVPTVAELESLLEQAEERFGRERLWVNPDCGLKTRTWPETIESLTNLIAATAKRRAAAPVSAP